MSHAKIRNIFNYQMSLFAEDNGLRIAFDNINFSPDVNETYIQCHLVPADTITRTLSGDHKEYLGFYQMKVITASGDGSGSADDVVEKLQAKFPVDSVFSEDTITDEPTTFYVQIISPVYSPDGKDQYGSWVIPCRFQYRADTV
jgi:hypothetical protein